MKILIAFALLFSTQLYAEDVVSSHYICTHKDNNHVREVKITHQYPGCQVIYIKANETNNIMGDVVWSAQNSTDYCDEKGLAFVEEKLQRKYGWVCLDELNK